jgi:hypothetical protein
MIVCRAVDRPTWRQEALKIRARFDAAKNEYDRNAASALLVAGEVRDPMFTLLRRRLVLFLCVQWCLNLQNIL